MNDTQLFNRLRSYWKKIAILAIKGYTVNGENLVPPVDPGSAVGGAHP